MSCKTIIAYLSRRDGVTEVMNVALPLARKHSAHLIGLHVYSGVPIVGTIGAQIPPEIIEQYAQTMREDADAIGAVFKSLIKGSEVQAEWCCHERKEIGTDLLSAISQRVRCADLVVMGQAESEQRVGELTADIILSAGRPAIVVPEKTAETDLTGKIVVAWDGSREASRAAFDALPLLKLAESTVIVTIQKRKTSAVNSGGADLALCLARHGVTVEATTLKATGSTHEALAKFASERDSDLIVMGCYGHSRLRERLFGGATQGMLEKLPLPVMMSH